MKVIDHVSNRKTAGGSSRRSASRRRRPQGHAWKARLGKLEWEHRPEVTVSLDEAKQELVVDAAATISQARALHGLTRAMVQNMMVGVTQGYQRRLEIVGVGYLAAMQKDVLQLAGRAWPTSSRCRSPPD